MKTKNKYQVGDLVNLSNPQYYNNLTFDRSIGIILIVEEESEFDMRRDDKTPLHYILDFKNNETSWWHSDYFRKLK